MMLYNNSTSPSFSLASTNALKEPGPAVSAWFVVLPWKHLEEICLHRTASNEAFGDNAVRNAPPHDCCYRNNSAVPSISISDTSFNEEHLRFFVLSHQSAIPLLYPTYRCNLFGSFVIIVVINYYSILLFIIVMWLFLGSLLPHTLIRITTKSIHESITFCNRAATHFSTLQTVCATAIYLSVWPTKKRSRSSLIVSKITLKNCWRIPSQKPTPRVVINNQRAQIYKALTAGVRHSSCSSQSFLLLMMQEWLMLSLPLVKKRWKFFLL